MRKGQSALFITATPIWKLTFWVSLKQRCTHRHNLHKHGFLHVIKNPDLYLFSCWKGLYSCNPVLLILKNYLSLNRVQEMKRDGWNLSSVLHRYFSLLLFWHFIFQDSYPEEGICIFAMQIQIVVSSVVFAFGWTARNGSHLKAQRSLNSTILIKISTISIKIKISFRAQKPLQHFSQSIKWKVLGFAACGGCCSYLQ